MKRIIARITLFIIAVAAFTGCGTFGIATKADLANADKRTAIAQQTAEAAKAGADKANASIDALAESTKKTASAVEKAMEAAKAAHARAEAVNTDLGRRIDGVRAETGNLRAAQATDKANFEAKVMSVKDDVKASERATSTQIETLEKKVGIVGAKAAEAIDRTVIAGVDPKDYVLVGSFEVARLNEKGDELMRAAKVTPALEKQIERVVVALMNGRKLKSIEAYADPRSFPGISGEESAKWNKKASELRGEAVKAHLKKYKYDNDDAKQKEFEDAIEAVKVEDKGATSKFSSLDKNRVVVVRFE